MTNPVLTWLTVMWNFIMLHWYLVPACVTAGILAAVVVTIMEKKGER